MWSFWRGGSRDRPNDRGSKGPRIESSGGFLVACGGDIMCQGWMDKTQRIGIQMIRITWYAINSCITIKRRRIKTDPKRPKKNCIKKWYPSKIASSMIINPPKKENSYFPPASPEYFSYCARRHIRILPRFFCHRHHLSCPNTNFWWKYAMYRR